jgi:repressor LexA
MARSDRRDRILSYIQAYVAERGFPPTIREIGEAVDIKSTSVVEYHLKKMTQLGMLERSQRVSRGLRVGPDRARGMIPCVGTIAAGAPISVPDARTLETADEWIEVGESLVRRRPGHDVFALKVRGDSMIDALVDDGDIVILEKVDAASDGDMVAAWIVDEETTTLKWYYREKGRIRLQPANPALKPIMVDEENLRVQGKVVAVIRRLAA